jgi:S-formylglutathione hydrolase FrmB
MKKPIFLCGIFLLLGGARAQAESTAKIEKDAQSINAGIASYTVSSAYQKGPNALEVLLPDNFSRDKKYPVIYVLPVNTGTKGNWGSGIVEMQKANLHNIYNVICVAPAVDSEPWYGDNPDNPKVRQSAYVLDVVIPFIDREYPTIAEAKGRMVLGFSKSGLGAMSLFLRNLETFGKVAVFDAATGPASQEIFKTWGFAESYGTRENFDNYDPLLLLEKAAPILKGGSRRIVMMAGGPGSRLGVDMMVTHMQDGNIPFVYILGSNMGHSWNTGWLPIAAGALMCP